MSSLVKYARTVARKGYNPIPLNPETKCPMDTGWPNQTISKTILDKYENNPRYKTADMGFITRKTPAIDFDILDIDICQQMVKFVQDRVDGPLVLRTGQAPKTLAVFQCEDPFKKMTSKKYIDFMDETQQIEILGDGQQFVAHGIHAKTGAPYQWSCALPPSEALPVLTPELAQEVIAEFERLAEAQGWELVSKGSNSGVVNAEETLWSPTNLSDEQRAAVIRAVPNEDGWDGWVANLAAIHYEFGGSEEGYALALEYSEKSLNHNNESTVRKRWDSFSINKPGGRTFASLIKQAKDAGYDVNAVDESTGKGTLAKFNRKYGLAVVEGVTSIVYRESDMSTGDPKICFMPVRYFKDLRNNIRAVDDEGEEILGGKKFDTPIAAANYWITHPKRNTYNQVYFKPEPGLVFNSKDPLPKGSGFNLYTGLKFQPVEGDWPLIRRHLLEIWCKGDLELFEYVLGWMGNMFQHPDQQGYSALILKSEEGGGKNVIIDLMIDALGAHGAVCTKPEDITGRFNSFISTAVFIFMNEAIWGGNRQLEGPMKSLITDDYLVVERKFIERFKIKNCTHLMFASNNEFPAYIGRTDRRNVVLELDEKYTNDPVYFDPLRKEIQSGGKEAFIYHLLNMDLSGFNPRKLPAGSGLLKHEIKLEGGSTIEQWFAECLDLGEIRGSRDSVIDADDWEEQSENLVSRKLLLESLEHFSHVKKSNARGTSINLGRFLLKSGMLIRKSRGAYVIPDIGKCHELFDKYMQKRK